MIIIYPCIKYKHYLYKEINMLLQILEVQYKRDPMTAFSWGKSLFDIIKTLEFTGI